MPALSEFFGDGAGLSGPVVARLTRTWQDEQAAFASRSLAEVDYAYIWVDGIHFNVRLGEDLGRAVWSWSACGPTGAKRARGHHRRLP